MTGARRDERGAALLVVIIAVAVLTALAVDLAYQTRVSLQIAANARDDLKASYLAKGGVALSRVVLSLQQDVDAQLSTAGLPGGATLPRPQLWRLVSVDSDLAARLFGGARGAPAASEGAPAPAGDGFAVAVEDEGAKVNVQLDALPNSALLASQVQAIYQLVCDPRWDALFDREDEHGTRVSRHDLLVYLRDWVDPDSQGSALAAAFPAGSCVIVTPQKPFEDGFQDENYVYDRGEDRYRAKNARMDSLAELSMVAGVTDAFLAAFGDAITVYMPRDVKPNVNTTDRQSLLQFARFVADPPNHPALDDPQFADRLHKLVLERTLQGILSLSAAQLGQAVQEAGVTVNANKVTAGSGQNPFDDRSSVFRVRAQGRAGDVEKTIDAVLWFEQPRGGAPAPAPGRPAAPQVANVQPVAVPGKLLHWREE